MNKTKKNKNFTSNEWYNNSYVMSHFPRYRLFITVGSRGRGKTYSAKKYIIKRFSKGCLNKFMWLRRSEEDLKSIIAENGSNFFEPELLKKYNVTAKIDGDRVFLAKGGGKLKEIGIFKALSTYGKWKGNQFTDYDLMVVDEFVKTAEEKRIVNAPKALINCIESMIRENTKARVLIFSNAIQEMEELRQLLGWIPDTDKYGVYKFHHIETILEYLEDSEEWKARKANTLAGKLAKNIGGLTEFSNKINEYGYLRKSWVIKIPANIRRRKIFSIYLDEGILYHAYSYDEYVIFTKDREFEHNPTNTFTLRPKLLVDGAIYSKMYVEAIKTWYHANRIRFTTQYSMQGFLYYLNKYRIIT